MCVYVCVCVCDTHTHIYTHTHIHKSPLNLAGDNLLKQRRTKEKSHLDKNKVQKMAVFVRTVKSRLVKSGYKMM